MNITRCLYLPHLYRMCANLYLAGHILPAYNVCMGCLPWTTYIDKGFTTVTLEENGERLPWWKDKDHPELRRQLPEALAEGYGPKEFNAHLMVLDQ